MSTQNPNYLDGTREMLKESERLGRHYVTIFGKIFLIEPGVFSPEVFKDTAFFTGAIDYKIYSSFLEIGTGAGVTATFAALAGASEVFVTDIDEATVNRAVENINTNKIQYLGNLPYIHSEVGNLFEHLNPDKKFEAIYWNMPWGYVEYEPQGVEKTVFDCKYQNIKQFIEQAPSHLNCSGRILMGFSKTMGRYDLIKKFTKGAGLKLRTLATKYSYDGNPKGPITLDLLEAKR